MRSVFLAISLSLGLFLTACGQIGPLYLPDEEPNPAQTQK